MFNILMPFQIRFSHPQISLRQNMYRFSIEVGITEGGGALGTILVLTLSEKARDAGKEEMEEQSLVGEIILK